MPKVHGPERIADLPSVAWKNGGGTTRTLAVEPPQAGLDDFRWRISLAEIRGPGSFSSFDGVDRSIMLWSGEGVILRSSVWGEHALTTRWEPFSFRGEDDVRCELVGKETTDLNLMIRRGQVEAELLTFRSGTILSAPIEDAFLLCAQGEIRVLVPGRAPVVLYSECFVRISEIDSDISVVMGNINSFYICAVLKPL